MLQGIPDDEDALGWLAFLGARWDNVDVISCEAKDNDTENQLVLFDGDRYELGSAESYVRGKFKICLVSKVVQIGGGNYEN